MTVTATTGWAFQVEVVGERNVQRGVALARLLWHLAAVAGPAVAGVLMTTAGIGVVMGVAALCIGGVVVPLWAIDRGSLHVVAPSADEGLRATIREVRARRASPTGCSGSPSWRSCKGPPSRRSAVASPRCTTSPSPA